MAPSKTSFLIKATSIYNEPMYTVFLKQPIGM